MTVNENERQDKIVSFRLSENLYESLTSVAKRQGMQPSQVFRAAAQSYASGDSVPPLMSTKSNYQVVREALDEVAEVVRFEADPHKALAKIDGITSYALRITGGGETSDQESRKRKERDERRRRGA